MHKSAIFEAAAAERAAMADFVLTLDATQLATQSLCGEWDVQTVAGHLAAAVAGSKAAFVKAFFRHGMNPNKASGDLARQFSALGPAAIAGLLRDNANSTFAPPIVGAYGPFTDLLVHRGDISVPLGLPHDPPIDRVLIALGFVTGPHPIGFVAKTTLPGLHLVASDTDWEWGAGDRLVGRGIDVLMAVCGRTAVLDRLEGSGVALLRERLT